MRPRVTAIESVAVAKMRKSPSDCQVRALTRCLESTAAIVATKSLVAGVPQWLRACRDRASAHSGCPAKRLIPAHHHAFGNAFFRLPPETRRACPTAFWPHSAGSTASGRYYADDRPSSFRLRRNGFQRSLRFANNRGPRRCAASAFAHVATWNARAIT